METYLNYHSKNINVHTICNIYIHYDISASFQLPHILMNCIECSSPRVLFEHILNNIPLEPDRDYDTDDNDLDEDDYIQCENMTDFVRLLVNLVRKSSLGKDTLYIVCLLLFLCRYTVGFIYFIELKQQYLVFHFSPSLSK